MSISRATWSLIANNVVSMNLFLAFTIVEGCYSVFYAMLMQQIMLEQLKQDVNFTGSPPTISIPMSFITQYQTILNNNPGSIMVISFTLFAIYLALFIVLIILLFIQKSKIIKELSQSSTLHKVYGLILIIISKAVYMPMLEFTIRGYKSYQQFDLGVSIALTVINTLSLIAFLFMIFYARRVFKLCMLSEQIPWSGSNSKVMYFGFLAKVLNPIVLSIDTQGNYIYAEIIVSTIVQILYLAMTMFFADIYQQKCDMLNKFFQGAAVLIMLIGVVKYLIKDYDNKEYILFLCLIGFFLYFIYKLNEWRKERLIELYNQGKLKLELEYEYLLLHLQDLVRETMIDSAESQEYYSEILKLLELHQLQCFDNDCMCNRQEDFMDIFKQSQRQATTTFMVEKSKLKKIRHYISTKTNLWIAYTVGRTKENSLQQKYARKPDDEASLILDGDESSQQASSNKTNSAQNQVQNQIQQDIPAGQGLVSLDTLQRQNKAKRVKIDISHIKKRFITNFILIYFNEVKAKFPMSLKIHILCNYYSMFIVGRPNLAICQLRSFTDKNLSWLDRISKYANEFFILHEFERMQKQTSIEAQQLRIDGEHFIKVNDLYEEFHSQIDQMSNEGVQFWKGFNIDDIDPYKQYDYGEKIAESIRATYRTFKEIEENLIQKDFKIYVWFAQIQLKIMNDLDGYQIFIQKMRGVMQMNKMFQIADAHSQSAGRILFMNKILRRNLIRDQDELKFINITCAMPKQIAEKHDEFLKKYNKTGDSVLLDRDIVVFMIDKNQNLFPVELLIKFHYSQKFQYCFLAFVKTLREMVPYRDLLKYKTNQLVIMTIDLQDGQINEVSKNFINLLELAGINQYRDIVEISFFERKRTIQEILKNFQFQDVQALRKVRGMRRDFYENNHFLDLSSFSDSIEFQNYTLEELNAKVAIYVDTYGQGGLDIGYVIISLMNSNKSMMSIEDKSEDFQFKDQQSIYEDQMNKQIYENESGSGSQSGSGGGSSSGSSGTSTSYHAMQQFHSFYKQETPKILKIVIQLILFMFIVSITIATVNLVLNIQSHTTSELEIRQIRSSMDRLNFSVSIRVLLRSLLNIANGYESNQSKIIGDRFTSYLSMLSDKSDSLVNAEYYLENSGYQFSSNFSQELGMSQVVMTYLMDNGQYKYENVTMRNMISLYTSRLVQVQQYTQQQMKGNLYIQNLKPNQSASYQPSVYEQTIFFIIFNGDTVVRQYSEMFADMYIRDSIAKSTSNEQQTLITTIVSILTIFMVTCVISPIISKTEERKYNALVFFLKIPREEIELYIKNCQDCEKLDSATINSKNTYNVNKINADVNDLGSIDYTSMLYNDDLANEGQELRFQQENSILDTSQKRLMDQDSSMRVPQYQYNTKKSTFSNMLKSSQNTALSPSHHHHHHKHSQVVKDPSLVENQEEQVQNILKITQNNKIQRKQGKNIETESGKNSSIHSSSISSANQIFRKQKKEIKSEPEQTEDQKQQELKEEILNINLKKIRSIAFRKKTTTFLLVMILMIVFAVYFIISYFMAIQNYQDASSSSTDLGLIFSKEQCFENLFSYLRENEIRNQTLLLPDKITSATQYYLSQCSDQEQQYKNLRKNMPSYFVDAQYFINDIETSNYCDDVYQSDDPQKDQLCKISVNGLLNQGMTNTLYYMLNYAQKLELGFNSALSMRARNVSFLSSQIGDINTIELIDTKMYIMGDSFVELENECMNSALTYFKKLLSDFIAVYAVFIALLMVSMVYFTIFAFNRLRKSMWSTNMLLKIIPKHILTKDETEKLKQFFVN